MSKKEFLKKIFNNVPEALTFNNPTQGTQCGEPKHPHPTKQRRAGGTPQ